MAAHSIQPIEQWAAQRVQKVPFQILANAVIGVDASYYLNLRLNDPEREPLLHALSGTPYSLQDMIERDIQTLRKHDIKVVFVFDGLDFVIKRQQTGVQPVDTVRTLENAWSHYFSGDAVKTRADFSRARKEEIPMTPESDVTSIPDYPVEVLYRYVQKLLSQINVDYMVAPYGAAAQLSYLLHQPEQFIDVVMGSADCFLFHIDRIITAMDGPSGTFDCLNKSECQIRLDRSNDDLFRDCQLLLGSSYLPMFPPLARVAAHGKPNLRDALSLLVSSNRSVWQLCSQYRDDPNVRALQYEERYKKALMTIKHHVVMESTGAVAPMDLDHAPGDVHEFIGQRLPDELFFYISKGLIGPSVPNWLTSGEVRLSLPASVQDSSAYRDLVVDKLNDIRTQALKLLADSLNRYYQSRIINVKAWYDRDTSDLSIVIRNVQSAKEQMGTWKVKESKDWPTTIRQPPEEQSLLDLLRFLKEKSRPERTLSKYGDAASPALETRREVCFNVIWRFLHIRGYLDDHHQLTKWGHVLEATMAKLENEVDAEELAIVAIEMLRLNIWSGNDLAAPTTDRKEKISVNIITRVACLGRFKHKSKGYSGPLDRQLLAFAWMISAVRSSLRDLVETILVCMFLNGDAVRERKDWTELAQSLPFISDNGCGLGIAAKTYLDQVTMAENDDQKHASEVKSLAKQQKEPYRWFENAINYDESLGLAFNLWDALYAGVKAAGKDARERKAFDDADAWLSSRR